MSNNRFHFSDYQAIQSGLTMTDDIDIPYKTLWGWVHHRFQARPQRVRPQSPALIYFWVVLNK